MNYSTSDQNQVLFDQEPSLNSGSKPDIDLKMGLAELVFHAIVLILLV